MPPPPAQRDTLHVNIHTAKEQPMNYWELQRSKMSLCSSSRMDRREKYPKEKVIGGWRNKTYGYFKPHTYRGTSIRVCVWGRVCVCVRVCVCLRVCVYRPIFETTQRKVTRQNFVKVSRRGELGWVLAVLVFVVFWPVAEHLTDCQELMGYECRALESPSFLCWIHHSILYQTGITSTAELEKHKRDTLWLSCLWTHSNLMHEV